MRDSEGVKQEVISENIRISKEILGVIKKAHIKEKENLKTSQKTIKNNSVNNINYALAEAYDIITHSSQEIQNKISPKFMEILISGKDNSYISNLDYDKNLDEQIQHETKIILGLIYRDYLCDISERQELLKKETELLNRIEQERNEKYSVDNLFKNRPYTSNIQQPNQIQDNEQNKIIEYREEKWYEKIINFFKSLFGKK